MFVRQVLNGLLPVQGKPVVCPGETAGMRRAFICDLTNSTGTGDARPWGGGRHDIGESDE